MSKKTPDKPKKPTKSTKKSSKSKRSSSSKKKKIDIIPEQSYSQSPRYFLLSDKAKRIADKQEIDIDTIKFIYMPNGSEIIGQVIENSVDELMFIEFMQEEFRIVDSTRTENFISVLNPFLIVYEEFTGIEFMTELNRNLAYPVIELNTSMLLAKPMLVSIDMIEKYLISLDMFYDLSVSKTEQDLPIESITTQDNSSNIIDFSKYIK